MNYKPAVTEFSMDDIARELGYPSQLFSMRCRESLLRGI